MDDIRELFDEYSVFAAFGMTVLLTILSAIGSLIIGTIVGIMRVSPVPFLQRLGTLYVNIFRNTPLTLIVAFCALGFYAGIGLTLLPQATPLSWQNVAWGIVALSVYHAAFVAEALRSGVNTVPQGQAEAARAIGLDFGLGLREVILPQAFRGAIAPLGNTLIALTKNTTVLATIGVAEASYSMRNMIEFSPNLLFLIFGIIAFGFVVLTLPTGIFFTWWSRKLVVQR
jgi:glutamate transport system permease protein